MITPFLVGAASLGAAGWGLAQLRGKRLAARRLGRRFEQAYDALLLLDDDLAALASEAPVAALAEPDVGGRASDAGDRFLTLADQQRAAQDRLEAAEREWQRGREEVAHALLEQALGLIDGAATQARLLQKHLDEIRPHFDRPASGEAIARRLALVRKELQERARAMGQQVPRTAIEGALPAREAAVALARLEAHLPLMAREAAIRKRVDRELPPRAQEALAAVAEGNAWAGRLETWQLQAHDALRHDDLATAERFGNRALGLARRLADPRCPLPGVRRVPPAPLERFAAALYEAGVSPRAFAIGMAVRVVAAGALAFMVGSRLEGPVEVRGSTGNLALHRQVLSEASLDAAHRPAMVTDGDLKTAWLSGEPLYEEQAIVVDLGRDRPVQTVSVLPLAAPAGTCSWWVEGSSARGKWIVLGEGSGFGARKQPRWGDLKLDKPQHLRWVRLKPEAWGKSGVGIYEVRIYGPSS